MKKKQITKQEFLQDVRTEIENIKKYAKKSEIQKLDVSTFDPGHINQCVYGQMTTDCRSTRAKNLIYKCCERVVHNSEEDYEDFSQIKNNINGKVKESFTLDKFKNTRTDDFTAGYNILYLSSLEAYIQMKKAKNENVISYLKGETNKLVL